MGKSSWGPARLVDLPSVNRFSSDVKMATASLTKICTDPMAVVSRQQKIIHEKKEHVELEPLLSFTFCLFQVWKKQ